MRRAVDASLRSGDSAWQVGPKRRHIYGQQLPNLEKKLLPYASVVGLPAVFDKVRVQCVRCLREYLGAVATAAPPSASGG